MYPFRNEETEANRINHLDLRQIGQEMMVFKPWSTWLLGLHTSLLYHKAISNRDMIEGVPTFNEMLQ